MIPPLTFVGEDKKADISQKVKKKWIKIFADGIYCFLRMKEKIAAKMRKKKFTIKIMEVSMEKEIQKLEMKIAKKKESILVAQKKILNYQEKIQAASQDIKKWEDEKYSLLINGVVNDAKKNNIELSTTEIKEQLERLLSSKLAEAEKKPKTDTTQKDADNDFDDALPEVDFTKVAF